jgi:hypothetical protein
MVKTTMALLNALTHLFHIMSDTVSSTSQPTMLLSQRHVALFTLQHNMLGGAA